MKSASRHSPPLFAEAPGLTSFHPVSWQPATKGKTPATYSMHISAVLPRHKVLRGATHATTIDCSFLISSCVALGVSSSPTHRPPCTAWNPSYVSAPRRLNSNCEQLLMVYTADTLPVPLHHLTLSRNHAGLEHLTFASPTMLQPATWTTRLQLGPLGEPSSLEHKCPCDRW